MAPGSDQGVSRNLSSPDLSDVEMQTFFGSSPPRQPTEDRIPSSFERSDVEAPTRRTSTPNLPDPGDRLPPSPSRNEGEAQIPCTSTLKLRDPSEFALPPSEFTPPSPSLSDASSHTIFNSSPALSQSGDRIPSNLEGSDDDEVRTSGSSSPPFPAPEEALLAGLQYILGRSEGVEDLSVPDIVSVLPSSVNIVDAEEVVSILNDLAWTGPPGRELNFHRNNDGRFGWSMQTMAAIPAGEEICRSKTVLVSYPAREHNAVPCDNCHYHTGSRIHPSGGLVTSDYPKDFSMEDCEECGQVAYCSKECREEAWSSHHQFECVFMNAVASSPANVKRLFCEESQWPFRLLLRYYNGLISDAEWKPLRLLATTAPEAATDEEKIWLMRVLRGLEPLGLKEWMFPEALELLNVLRFHKAQLCYFIPDATTFSQHLNVLASLADHSCDPNAHVIYERGEVRLRSLRPIAAGECITWSRFDDTYDVAFRRKALYGFFGFMCTCDRCRRELKVWPQLFERFSEVPKPDDAPLYCEAFRNSQWDMVVRVNTLVNSQLDPQATEQHCLDLITALDDKFSKLPFPGYVQPQQFACLKVAQKLFRVGRITRSTQVCIVLLYMRFPSLGKWRHPYRLSILFHLVMCCQQMTANPEFFETGSHADLWLRNVSVDWASTPPLTQASIQMMPAFLKWTCLLIEDIRYFHGEDTNLFETMLGLLPRWFKLRPSPSAYGLPYALPKYLQMGQFDDSFEDSQQRALSWAKVDRLFMETSRTLSEDPADHMDEGYGELHDDRAPLLGLMNEPVFKDPALRRKVVEAVIAENQREQKEVMSASLDDPNPPLLDGGEGTYKKTNKLEEMMNQVPGAVAERDKEIAEIEKKRLKDIARLEVERAELKAQLAACEGGK